ncbi:RidA family protein [Sneathiella chinensis]|uniref:Enamine deaminase RidA n=1 Tax=Sneathiella chinensis TaxID=349750 RepID=A0ABQ5U0I2_9PROT|nr:RidA family protein [Sneathiella chinensis]GLQ04842.1 enamine deaminase RidA [Sneathiella chinensis]
MSIEIIHPEGWKPARGYANGVAASGRTLYVGGQIGWNADQVFETHDFIGQMEQTLRNVLEIVEAGGGRAEHIVRLVWYVVDKAEYKAKQREVGEVYRKVMGKHFPAMAMVQVAALMEDDALIEIEATAVVPA